MYDEAMRTSWKPHVMQLLGQATSKCEADLAAHGVPERPSDDDVFAEMTKLISAPDALKRRVDAVLKHINALFDEVTPFAMRGSASFVQIPIPDFAEWVPCALSELSKLAELVTKPSFVETTIVDLTWACVVDSASKTPFRMDRFKLYLEQCKGALHSAAIEARPGLESRVSNYLKRTVSPIQSRDIVFTPVSATVNLGQIRTTIITLVLSSLPGIGSAHLLRICTELCEPNAQVFKYEACAGAREDLKVRRAFLQRAAQQIERDLPDA